jgi:hypothetical protein
MIYKFSTPSLPPLLTRPFPARLLVHIATPGESQTRYSKRNLTAHRLALADPKTFLGAVRRIDHLNDSGSSSIHAINNILDTDAVTALYWLRLVACAALVAQSGKRCRPVCAPELPVELDVAESFSTRFVCAAGSSGMDSWFG